MRKSNKKEKKLSHPQAPFCNVVSLLLSNSVSLLRLNLDSARWAVLQVSHFSEHIHISKLVDPFLLINFILGKSCEFTVVRVCVCVCVCTCVSTGFGGLLNHLKDSI